MKRIAFGLITAALIASPASATITIEDLDENDMSHRCTVSWNGGTSSWDIWINSRAPGNFFVIRSDAGENIGIIRSMVASDGLSHTQVIIRVLSDQGSGVANLGEVRKVNTEIVIVNRSRSLAPLARSSAMR